MISELDRITNEALGLPVSSRAKLAEKLLESLDEINEVETFWADEAERRCREVDEAGVQLLPGEEVLREVRARPR